MIIDHGATSTSASTPRRPEPTPRSWGRMMIIDHHDNALGTNLWRKVKRNTKRHPLLVYKLVFATTRAANRVHFFLIVMLVM